MPERYDLESELDAARRPIDSAWSARKKKAIAAVCVLGSVAALGAGVWALGVSTAPGLPTTAAEAINVMDSDRFSRLDEQRRRQYASEARRLIGELSDEERQALFRDKENRDAFRVLREETFDEMVRRYARGEKFEFPGRGRRRAQGDQSQRPRLTEEEREQRREQWRDRIDQRLTDQLSSGNAQSGALRTEMFKRVSAAGGGGGRRGGRGGGGG